MKNKFLIILNSNTTENEMKLFSEAITSNYPSIKAGDNLFILKTDGTLNSKDIYLKIASKTKDKFSFVVLPFGAWWGDIFVNAFDWLEENFPEEGIERTNK
ncbi:MAG TPA: hypothetical protein VIV55_03655 [Flavobacterium sp.]